MLVCEDLIFDGSVTTPDKVDGNDVLYVPSHALIFILAATLSILEAKPVTPSPAKQRPMIFLTPDISANNAEPESPDKIAPALPSS